MKKLVLVLIVATLVSASAICSAASSIGAILDAEQAAVDKFLSAKDFKQVSSILHDEMKKDFTAANFTKFREIIANDFGTLRANTLRSIEKLDDADVLRYQAHFDKEPNAEYVFAFRVVGGKPYLFDFRLIKPQMSAQDSAQTESEQGK